MTHQPNFETTPEVKFAMQVVQQASLLAQRIQADMVTQQTPGASMNKADRSPVTVADFAIQAYIARRLMQTYPDHRLMAEEDASALAQSPLLERVAAFVSELEPDASPGMATPGMATPVMATPQTVCEWIDRGLARNGDARGLVGAPTWILDPIDGTKGFLRGGQYAVALALMVDGQVQVGVLGCPNLPGVDGTSGSLAVAVRGGGAWMAPGDFQAPMGIGSQQNWIPLRVSNVQDPTQARLLRSFEAGHTNVDQIEKFAETLGIQADAVLMDSQVKYAVLAAGQGDLMLRLLSTEQPNYREKAWDQAAGSLVVEEAGGCVTDLDGKPFDFTAGRELIHNRGVLVSNGWLHDAALQALKTVRA